MTEAKQGPWKQTPGFKAYQVAESKPRFSCVWVCLYGNLRIIVIKSNTFLPEKFIKSFIVTTKMIPNIITIKIVMSNQNNNYW